jgi:hypothetical protein
MGYPYAILSGLNNGAQNRFEGYWDTGADLVAEPLGLANSNTAENAIIARRNARQAADMGVSNQYPTTYGISSMVGDGLMSSPMLLARNPAAIGGLMGMTDATLNPNDSRIENTLMGAGAGKALGQFGGMLKSDLSPEIGQILQKLRGMRPQMSTENMLPQLTPPSARDQLLNRYFDVKGQLGPLSPAEQAAVPMRQGMPMPQQDAYRMGFPQNYTGPMNRVQSWASGNPMNQVQRMQPNTPMNGMQPWAAPTPPPPPPPVSPIPQPVPQPRPPWLNR